MKFFKENGCNICLVMGIDYSPSCAVSVITGRTREEMKKGKGIFIEELQYIMKTEGLSIPFVGARLYRIRETIQAIKAYIK